MQAACKLHAVLWVRVVLVAMFRQPCALAGFCRLAARGAERAAVGRLDVSWRPRTRSSGRRTLFSFIPPSVCPHIPQVKANPVAWLCMCPYTLLRRLIWRPAHEAFYCVVWPFGWSYYGRSARWYHMSQPMELLVLVWGRLDTSRDRSHIARTTFAPILVHSERLRFARPTPQSLSVEDHVVYVLFI